MNAAIRSAHGAFTDWLFGDALPFWSRVSLDKLGPGFCEHLTLDGQPAEVDFKRLRVQARQIYVFSQAHMLGWTGGAAIAAEGYGFIKSAALQASGEWAKTLRRDGSVLDPTVDLYDLAFVLFSLAWFARATRDPEPLIVARQTLAWMEQYMVHEHGGYRNSTQRQSGPRLQNSHMHMLEATLALYESSSEQVYADCALNMVRLFRTHFKDATRGVIGEYYTEQLASIPGPEGEHVEPGHLYEWVWLLEQVQVLLGVDTRQDMHDIYRFAEAHSIQANAVSIVDVITRSGSPVRSSRRLWPQTESIRAHCVMFRGGQPACGKRLVDSIRQLLAAHFSDCPRGAWRETFDEDGCANADKIPASSLYHVMTAYSEISRLVVNLD